MEGATEYLLPKPTEVLLQMWATSEEPTQIEKQDRGGGQIPGWHLGPMFLYGINTFGPKYLRFHKECTIEHLKHLHIFVKSKINKYISISIQIYRHTHTYKYTAQRKHKKSYLEMKTQKLYRLIKIKFKSIHVRKGKENERTATRQKN